MSAPRVDRGETPTVYGLAALPLETPRQACGSVTRRALFLSEILEFVQSVARVFAGGAARVYACAPVSSARVAAATSLLRISVSPTRNASMPASASLRQSL